MDSLLGITMGDWWKLLKENHFEIDSGYKKRAFLLSILSLFNSIGRKKEEKLFRKIIDETEIKQDPIFVLGHWRSGTTFLHNLITLDDKFAYPTLFEVSNPHTFLHSEEKVEKRLANTQPKKRVMDNVKIDFKTPAEDEFGMAILSLRSPIISWAFPKKEQYYDRYLTFKDVPESEIKFWLKCFIRFLKKLTLKHKRPMILKSPHHTCRIKILLDAFPNAKFIHIHRNPFTVFQSSRHLYKTAVPGSSFQKPNLEIIDQNIIKRYALMYNVFFDERKMIPKGQYCEVCFEEMVKDKVGQVGKIYEHLNIPGFDKFKPKLQAYVDSIVNYEKNVHKPLSEEQKKEIAQEWKFCFEEWGYKRD